VKTSHAAGEGGRDSSVDGGSGGESGAGGVASPRTRSLSKSQHASLSGEEGRGRRTSVSGQSRRTVSRRTPSALGTTTSGSPPSSSPTLPPPWVTHVDESGRTYYANTLTNETSWEIPVVADPIVGEAMMMGGGGGVGGGV
jgi:hypothetical protein